jgi:hypothetical protein
MLSSFKVTALVVIRRLLLYGKYLRAPPFLFIKHLPILTILSKICKKDQYKDAPYEDLYSH